MAACAAQISGTKDSLFAQYEKVIINSIITSFGLDMFIKDRHGGDVDTIHNVRQIGKDPNMGYKSAKNAKNWSANPEYSQDIHNEIHRNGQNFRSMKHEAREAFQATGKTIRDEYTGGDIGFYGHTKAISPDKKAELDHIISSKEIHNDRGRVLAGLDATELADDKSNLAFTNKSLNASLGDKKKSDYVNEHPELSEKTKSEMLKKDKDARAEYEKKLNEAYYSSASFKKDLVVAAGTAGIKMGTRQMLGFVFSEMWFAVKEELDRFNSIMNADMGEVFRAIGNGVKKGLENCKKNYKALLDSFKDGAIAGFLSSVTTTLCNIFFTTAKNVVRIIRQTWVSIVEAVKILFINPDHLLFGDRMLAASKVIATGASVVVGSLVSEAISKTAIGAFPVVGEIVQAFCGAFVSGIMSCTLLYVLDNSTLVKKIVAVLNTFKTSLTAYSERLDDMLAILEEYAAKVMDLDVEKFKQETEVFNGFANQISDAADDAALNNVLKDMFKKMGWKPVYDQYESFDAYMKDKNAPPLEFC